jgi:putative transposase
VASKNHKEFMADLKGVYHADSKEKAKQQLDELEKKRGAKNPVVISSWRNNWHTLSCYFKYAKDVLKLIYNTNTIEGFQRQVRKVTKIKTAFTTDMALMKLIYLAHRNIRKKWT